MDQRLFYLATMSMTGLFLAALLGAAGSKKKDDHRDFSFCVVADARCGEGVDRNYPERENGVAKFA